MKYRWMVAFTRSPMFDTMELPASMAKVVRELLMFLYRTSQEERGFTQSLCMDIWVAIAHHTDYGVPLEHEDETLWLLALLDYIEGKVGLVSSQAIAILEILLTRKLFRTP